MPAYTLAQAISATGRSRSALQRAIRSGKLSASRDASGAYLVDAAELARVYGSVSPPASSVSASIDADRFAALSARLAGEEARNTVLNDTVNDLRRRLDRADDERARLQMQLGEALAQVRALTDQRSAAPARRGWWWWQRRA